MSLRWSRWTRPRCSILRFGAGAVSALALALSGCLYGFAGGGLPNIKTVAILPFDNQTAEPALTKEVNDAVLEAFQRRLGLRIAGENNADAVVRGKVTRYDPDLPAAFRAGQGRTDVTQRQVQITIDVEILDQREGKTLWQRQGLSETGNYTPPQEAAGRKLALENLVNDLVDGAQSQW
ncbi:MAG TPA: LptE family protein [Gemmatimonadales bacterium]